MAKTDKKDINGSFFNRRPLFCPWGNHYASTKLYDNDKVTSSDTREYVYGGQILVPSADNGLYIYIYILWLLCVCTDVMKTTIVTTRKCLIYYNRSKLIYKRNHCACMVYLKCIYLKMSTNMLSFNVTNVYGSKTKKFSSIV